MTYYIVLIISVVVSVVSGCRPDITRTSLQNISAAGHFSSKNNNYDCKTIHISHKELLMLMGPQYNVAKRCDVTSRMLSVTIEFDDVVAFAKCNNYINDKRIGTTIFATTIFAERTLIIHYLMRNMMSIIWECQVTSTSGQSNIYFETKRKGYKLYQKLFVNRLSAVVTDSENLLPSFEYYYQSGDTLNVTCINLDSSCMGFMVHETAEGHKNQIDEYTNIWNVGFHKKLRRKDNNTRIYCISKCFNFEHKITVTFLETLHSEPNIFVIINGVKVVEIPSNRWFFDPYYVSYAYFVNDDFLNITCDARELGDVKLQSYCYNCEFQDQKKIIKSYTSSFFIKPHQLSKIVFNITQKHAILEQVVIFFTQIPTYMSSFRTTLHPTSSTCVNTSVTATKNFEMSTSATSATYTTSPVVEEQGSVITIVIVVVVIIIVLGVSVVVYKMKMRYCYKQIRPDSNHDPMDTIQYTADIPTPPQRDDDTQDSSQAVYDYAYNETTQKQDHLYDYPILNRRDQCPVPQTDASKNEYDYASPFG